CVSGDTFILTDQGQIPIKDLVNQSVNVWNGEEWSQVVVKQTGVNQELVNVKFSNGVDIKCTPYHKFLLNNGKIVDAQNLKKDDKLIKYKLPTIEFKSNDMKSPYTQGFFTGDGTYDKLANDKLKKKLYLYGEKKKLLEYIDHRYYFENVSADRYDVYLFDDIEEKFYVPFEQSIETKLRWFEGYSDA